jgi:hypothetical protein
MQLVQFFTNNYLTVEELEECRDFYALKREAEI